MTGTRRFQTPRARNHANPRTLHPDQVALYIHTRNRTPQQNAASMTRETLQGLFAVPVLLKDSRPRSAIHVRLRNARPLRSPRVTGDIQAPFLPNGFKFNFAPVYVPIVPIQN